MCTGLTPSRRSVCTGLTPSRRSVWRTHPEQAVCVYWTHPEQAVCVEDSPRAGGLSAVWRTHPEQAVCVYWTHPEQAVCVYWTHPEQAVCVEDSPRAGGLCVLDSPRAGGLCGGLTPSRRSVCCVYWTHPEQAVHVVGDGLRHVELVRPFLRHKHGPADRLVWTSCCELDEELATLRVLPRRGYQTLVGSNSLGLDGLTPVTLTNTCQMSFSTL